MISLTEVQTVNCDIDLKLTEQDIEAMKNKNTSMKTNDYLEFLKSVNTLAVDVKFRKGPCGERFELP